MRIVGQRCWFVQRWIESYPPLSSYCHLLLPPFSFFHKSNGVKRYNFLCLPASSRRRGIKRKSSGHKHLGKFTPCPLNLMENKLASLCVRWRDKRGCALRKLDTITGHHTSQSRTSQMANRSIGAQEDHILHLYWERKALPHMDIVLNSGELAGAMLMACVINT